MHRTAARARGAIGIIACIGAVHLGCGGAAPTNVAPVLTDAGIESIDASAPDASASAQPDAGSCTSVNPCGGCTVLAAAPLSSCTEDGTSLWVCNGAESVACVPSGIPRTVTATTTDPDRVRVTWTAPIGKVPDDYLVVREGKVVANLPSSSTTFDDDTADAPTVAPATALTATNGTWSGGVRIAWAPALAAPGTPYTYAVVARYGSSLTDPAAATAVGQRGAPSAAYDVEVRGEWIAVGDATSYDDTAAPLGTLLGATSVTADEDANVVRVHVVVSPADSPGLGTYRLRTRVGNDVRGESAAVTGRRGIGRAVRTQWQRSAVDTDADYTDLEDVTGLDRYDDAPPIDGSGRWYRAVLHAEGAIPATTVAKRAVLTRYSTIAGLTRGELCALRSADGAFVCWYDGPADDHTKRVVALADKPYTKLFADDEAVCAFQANGQAPVCESTWDIPTPPSEGFVSYFPTSGCGLLSTGEVRCAAGVAGPAPGERFRALAAVHQGIGCGLRLSDGHPLCWGLTESVQAGGLPDEPFDDIVAGQGTICGRRSSDHLTFCFDGAGTVVPLKALAGSPPFLCGIRETDDLVLCRSSGGQWKMPAVYGEGDYWSERFVSLQASYGGYCGTLVDGTRACRGYGSFNFQGGGQFAFTGRAGCILRDDGALRCSTSDLFPKGRFRSVGVGRPQLCGIRETNGEVVCSRSEYFYAAPSRWGEVNQLVPIRDSVCALRAKDSLLDCWGPGTDSGFGGTWLYPFTFISTNGAEAFLNIRADDGSIEMHSNWLGMAPPVGSFITAAGSAYHACALGAVDKRTVCWGQNWSGGAPPGPSTDAYDAIAAGVGMTCAIQHADGRLRCWGQTMPATPTDFTVTALAARGSTVCAVRQDDETLACGNELWAPDAAAFLMDPVRSVDIGADGRICFVKYDGHMGCRPK